jgi:uncharacterized protein (TIRG00374 family)
MDKIIDVVLHINKPILILVFLLYLFTYVLGFLRWRMLLIGLGLNLSNFLIFRSFCIGYFANLFFPSTIGGDLIRGIDLGLRVHNPRRVTASIILDRISGYSALVFICLIAIIIGKQFITDMNVFIVLGVILAFLGGVLAILFNKFFFSKCAKLLHLFGSIGQTLSNLHLEIYNFGNRRRIIVRNFIYSLIIQAALPLIIYLITLALGVNIKVIYFFILVPIVTAISALPFSVAGLGLREASSMYFFAQAGMSGEIALTVSLLSFAIICLLGLSGGIIYVLTFPNRWIQRNQTG